MILKSRLYWTLSSSKVSSLHSALTAVATSWARPPVPRTTRLSWLFSDSRSHWLLRVQEEGLCAFSLMTCSMMVSMQLGFAGQCSRMGPCTKPRCRSRISVRSWSRRSRVLYLESSCSASVILAMSSCVMTLPGPTLANS
uniref:Uncharacterized protein n=1 Tax=Ixodes ricinus TaxID=34613 RepID=A0A6B0UTN4_IXORI